MAIENHTGYSDIRFRYSLNLKSHLYVDENQIKMVPFNPGIRRPLLNIYLESLHI